MYEASISQDKAQADADNKELLKAQLENLEKLKNENKTISAKYSTVLGELRKRPTRAEQAEHQRTCAANDQTDPAIGGASLSREDAEFLVGEASRAEMIQAERDHYYNELVIIYQKTNKEN